MAQQESGQRGSAEDAGGAGGGGDAITLLAPSGNFNRDP